MHPCFTPPDLSNTADATRAKMPSEHEKKALMQSMKELEATEQQIQTTIEGMRSDSKQVRDPQSGATPRHLTSCSRLMRADGDLRA